MSKLEGELGGLCHWKQQRTSIVVVADSTGTLVVDASTRSTVPEEVAGWTDGSSGSSCRGATAREGPTNTHVRYDDLRKSHHKVIDGSDSSSGIWFNIVNCKGCFGNDVVDPVM